MPAPQSRPPCFATWLARLCLPGVDADAVLGDLEETYAALHRRYGQRAARRWYRRQVLRSMPRLILRTLYWSLVMLTNYVTMAFRHFKKQKGYAIINLFGLASGLACCLLILLYVQHELSYDRFHEHADRIYRVVEDLSTPSNTNATTTIPAAFAPAATGDFSEIEQAVRLFSPPQTPVAYGDRLFQEPDFFYADATMFEIFSFPLLQGDPATALDAPFSLVLTESTARKYFGRADPVGKVLTVGDTLDFHVTGVVQDVPSESHFHFDIVASMASWEIIAPDIANAWAPHMYYTYLLMAPEASAAALESKFPALVERSVDLSEGWSFDFSLQPLPSIHFHSHRSGELEANGRLEHLYLFTAIALFILLIACINFMNLATARSSQRTREVGMRKVLGAHRRQLVGQFLGEALLMSLTATALAVVLVILTLPAFNTLADKDLTLDVLGQWPFLAALSALTLGVGVLAGSYPAFFLSAFRPLATLKGLPTHTGKQRAASRLRSVLVVFQFAVSVFLIAGTAIVFSQLHFMRTRHLGFAPEQVVVLSSLNARQADLADLFKQEVLGYASVQRVAMSNSIPGRGTIGLSFQAEAMPENHWRLTEILFADPGFVKTYQMDIVAGRDFSGDLTTDTTGSFLLNEAMVKELGWTPEEAIGKTAALRRGGGRIVGVVKDFHFTSLQTAVEPLVILPTPVAYGSAPLYLSLRIRAEDLPGTLAQLEDTWRTLIPHRPFDYFFLDEDFDRQYKAEDRLGRIFGVFAGLAILIACLGLFGLAAYTVEQRTKEIGVRKVLGASMPGLVGLLTTDILKLVALAFVLAAPVTYLAMHRWLDDFAYRIEMSAWTFLMAGLFALLVASLTVSYQAIKAARANPVDSLRHE